MLLLAGDVLLHPRQVVVDRVRRRRRRRRAVHALAQLVLDGGASGGVVACRGPACENAGHDGDARVFGLPLGIVDAQRFQRRETDCLGAPGHVGRIGAVRKKD